MRRYFLVKRRSALPVEDSFAVQRMQHCWSTRPFEEEAQGEVQLQDLDRRPISVHQQPPVLSMPSSKTGKAIFRVWGAFAVADEVRGDLNCKISAKSLGPGCSSLSLFTVKFLMSSSKTSLTTETSKLRAFAVTRENWLFWAEFCLLEFFSFPTQLPRQVSVPLPSKFSHVQVHPLPALTAPPVVRTTCTEEMGLELHLSLPQSHVSGLRDEQEVLLLHEWSIHSILKPGKLEK